MRLDEAPRGGAPAAAGMPPTRDRPWRGRRAGLLSASRLALLRLARSKALLLLVGLGILVAVVLVCTVPLFNTLVENVQLQQALTSGGPIVANTETKSSTDFPPPTANVEIDVSSPSIASSWRAVATSLVTGLASQYLRGIVSPLPTYYAASDRAILVQAGSIPPAQLNPANFYTPDSVFLAFDYAAAAPHMHLLAGTIPAPGATDGALITQQMASVLKLRVGDPLVWTSFGKHSDHLALTVAGIWQPASPTDPYWNGLSFNTEEAKSHPYVFPVLVTTQTFFSQVPALSTLGMSQRWVYYTRPTHITVASASAVLSSLTTLRSRINGDLLAMTGFTEARVSTVLDSAIAITQQSQGLVALPLYIIVAQILGLALLFVAAMAGLLIEGQGLDIATLKSRGMSGTQILGAYVTQGIVLAVVAIILGPFLASVLALLLVQRFVPAAYATAGTGSTNAAFLSQLASPQAVLLPALVGALLGVATIALTALQAARLDVLAFRREQARPTHVPLWRRYYLDLVLVLLCVVGYLELGQFGGASTRAELGGGANPLLLVTPALLLLAGALLVLRLVPLAASLGARLAGRGRGVTAMLAFAQVERTPGRYARMTLLLVLAVGMGLFALTFSASLQQNLRDQLTYGAGADIRATTLFTQGGTQQQPYLHGFLALPGVVAATPVYRSIAYVAPDQGQIPADVLAIDPSSFATVAGPVSWRGDYAAVSLASLLRAMRAHAQGANAGLPGAPIWAIISQARAEQANLHVGDPFAAQPSASEGGPVNFVVGAIVPDFPTLYPGNAQGGFLVVPFADYMTAIGAGVPGAQNTIGPNEFWLRTTPAASSTASPAYARLIDTLDAQAQALNVTTYISLPAQLAGIASNPVSGGMQGLLLIGAITAALLAIIGSVVQSLLAAHQRTTQFAILRTIGLGSRELLGELLGEQIVVYGFGLAGGTLLGLLLTTATLPFLQFSTTTVNTVTLGVPPYVILFNWAGIGIFYAVLLLTIVGALAIAARYAAAIGLGKALRLGED